MAKRPQPKTDRERALVDVIDWALAHIERMGCTCVDNEQYNGRHAKENRRRLDSPCSGLAVAVDGEMQKRRALRRKGTK